MSLLQLADAIRFAVCSFQIGVAGLPSITKLVIMVAYGRQLAAGATEIGADRGRTDAAPGSGRLSVSQAYLALLERADVP